MKKEKIRKWLLSFMAAASLFSVSLVAGPQKTQTVQAISAKRLSSLNFHKKEIIIVNHDRPHFSRHSKSRRHGPWQKFSNLDFLNRAHAANALLNKKLMPHSPRTALTWDPTGWHNKRIASGWLYNRCHLIGFQLSGQNNNPRNLITGTRQLNDPNMLRYENKVADYIRQSKHHYIRYRVTPIYRGHDLLARGVEMEAQSIGDNSVHFNIYIFNVQPGMVLNYKTGTSRVKHGSSVIASHVRSRNHYHLKKKRVIHHKKNTISTAKFRIVGNRRSHIYHVMNGENCHLSSRNAVLFPSEAAARRAGYRKSLR